MNLIVTGTIGIDTVETPGGGRREDLLGGSAVYFAAAASFYTQTRLVAAVGDDFPDEFLQSLKSFEGLDTAGLEIRAGSKTFRWGGKYHEDMDHRDTLFTDLGALDESPIADRAMDGSLRLVLRSDRLGTLSPGNPVFYREIRVGTIREAHLTSDSTSVMIAIDIDPRYTPLVRENTKFWRSGGVGVDFGLFRGLSVQADSLEALMSSSISFATPEKRPGDLAIAGTAFELADSADEDWLKWSPSIDIGE